MGRSGSNKSKHTCIALCLEPGGAIPEMLVRLVGVLCACSFTCWPALLSAETLTVGSKLLYVTLPVASTLGFAMFVYALRQLLNQATICLGCGPLEANLGRFFCAFNGVRNGENDARGGYFGALLGLLCWVFLAATEYLLYTLRTAIPRAVLDASREPPCTWPCQLLKWESAAIVTLTLFLYVVVLLFDWGDAVHKVGAFTVGTFLSLLLTGWPAFVAPSSLDSLWVPFCIQVGGSIAFSGGASWLIEEEHRPAARRFLEKIKKHIGEHGLQLLLVLNIVAVMVWQGEMKEHEKQLKLATAPAPAPVGGQVISPGGQVSPAPAPAPALSEEQVCLDERACSVLFFESIAMTTWIVLLMMISRRRGTREPALSRLFSSVFFVAWPLLSRGAVSSIQDGPDDDAPFVAWWYYLLVPFTISAGLCSAMVMLDIANDEADETSPRLSAAYLAGIVVSVFSVPVNIWIVYRMRPVFSLPGIHTG